MFAELTDSRCFYELLGAGDPVVLVPGLGSVCASWDAAATELAKSFSVIVFDNRGMGNSIAKRPPQTLTDFSVDIVELLDHLQLERAHVIGLSLGGIIAQQLAVDHPSRVDRMVLVSCTHRFEPYLREMMMMLGRALRYFPPALFRRTVELLGTSPQYFDAHPKEIDRRIELACQMGVPRSAVARQLRCLGCHDMEDHRYWHITAPTLVIAGEHDMLIPAYYAQQMSHEIPGSEFLLVPGCGHNPFDEQLEFVVPRITDFLMRAHDDRTTETKEAQLATEATV